MDKSKVARFLWPTVYRVQVFRMITCYGNDQD